MSLSLKEVDHIANLARMELSEEEKLRYQQQLSAILDYVRKLQEIDTGDIPPTSSVLPARSVLREDGAREGLEIDQLLANAPQTDKNQFRVPPVLE